MHNLSSEESRFLFYPSSNTGIIYDYVAKQNIYLQGHMNIITCSAVSRDKSFIITADKGENSMIIQWDAHTGDPIRTFTNKSPQGNIAVDISYDNNFIALISYQPHHALYLYSLNGTEDNPIFVSEINHVDLKDQFYVRFNETSNELVTNNQKFAIFWHWHYENDEAVVNMYAKTPFPSSTEKECLTMTCFIPKDTEIEDFEEKRPNKLINRAISGTSRGRIVIWDEDQFSDLENEENKRSVLKVIDLTEKNEENSAAVKKQSGKQSKNSALNVVTVIDKYIVVGINDGRVCFYDSKLRIEGYFDLKGRGDISSISFANQFRQRTKKSDKMLWDPKDFWCPDFVVATKTGLVLKFDHSQFTNHVREDDKSDAIILTGLEKEVTYMSVHPFKPELAIVCRSKNSKDGQVGKIELWDYNRCEIKKIKAVTDEPSAIEYSPDGKTLLVAWSNGTLHILHDNENTDALLDKLEERNNTPRIVFDDKSKESFRIRKMKFCPDSRFFAVCNNCSLVLFGRTVSYDKLYKIVSHSDPKISYTANEKIRKVEFDRDVKKDDSDENLFLTDFCFAEIQTEKEDEKYAVFSVGNDRFIIQHRLYGNSFKDVDMIIERKIRIEWDFEPKSITYYPHHKEHLLAISTSDFKIKLFNISKEGFQHTYQGPDFGEIRESCIQELWTPKQGESEEENQFYIFSTKNSIIGMIRKPVDGNPHKNIGIVAHPTFLRTFCVKPQEGLIFTSGGEDLSIKVWEVNKQAVDRQLELADGLVHQTEEDRLIALVGDVELYQDMKDYFYYTQLRDASNKNSKNVNNLDREKTKKTRILTDSIPVSEMPNIFRALGYYPSDLEVESMKNEIRAINDKYAIEGTRKHDQVTFSILVNIFVNYRPYNNLDNDVLIQSLKVLGKEVNGEHVIDMHNMVALLTEYGEKFETKEYLMKVIEELAGPEYAKTDTSIPVSKFTKNILGLQTVNDLEGIKELEALQTIPEEA